MMMVNRVIWSTLMMAVVVSINSTAQAQTPVQSDLVVGAP